MKTILLITIFTFFAVVTNAKPMLKGVAVIVDSESYRQLTPELTLYCNSLEKDGLKSFLIVDRWNHPDSIKNHLIELYHRKTNPIEGAVFIGDIPVPMIRDAQHLTSAFKMNQERYDWSESSVPSDRFYDDFDLQFSFLKQDSVHTNYFYYSLLPGSAQKLRPEIYTGRIKPFESPHKYEDLKKYLLKVVQFKEEQHPLDQLLYFAGHGYNSDARRARTDEKIAFREQFPWFKKQQNAIEYIDHSVEFPVRDRLLSELQRKNLDMAVLHHHGAEDTEYLNGSPEVSNINSQIDGVKYFLRSKLRSAKDSSKLIARYMNQYKVPRSWFEGAFSEDVIADDSLFNAEMDIHIPDVLSIKPQVPFLVLDACFNGSFHLDEYLAGAYIFNDGNTLAVQANSVNALQDKWANEFLGLLGLGLRVGQWNQLNGYLESHIIGDPTLHFSSADPLVNMAALFSEKQNDKSFWLEQLDAAFPEMQTLALRMLYENRHDQFPALLLETYKQSESEIVRMECLKILTAYDDDHFIKCLSLAVNDSYEMVQRQAVYLIGKSGDARLINPLLSVFIRNNASKRVAFATRNSLGSFAEEDLLAAFDLVFNQEQHFVQPDTMKMKLQKSLSNLAGRWSDDFDALFDSKTRDKTKSFAINMLRNYNYHPYVGRFCTWLVNQSDESLKVQMLEALGWFTISCEKDKIIAACREIAENPDETENVKRQAMKTAARLNAEWWR